jgi:hypothetical protein
MIHGMKPTFTIDQDNEKPRLEADAQKDIEKVIYCFEKGNRSTQRLFIQLSRYFRFTNLLTSLELYLCSAFALPFQPGSYGSKLLSCNHLRFFSAQHQGTQSQFVYASDPKMVN